MNEIDKLYFQAGIDIIFYEIPEIISCIILGFFFKIPLQMIVFLFTSCLLRVHAGSYHADTHIKCYAFFLVNASAVALLIRLGSQACVILLAEFAVLCSCFIVSKAPLVHRHNPLTDLEIAKASLISRILLSIYVTAMLACITYYPSFSLALACSIIHIAVCMTLMVLMHQEIHQ